MIMQDENGIRYYLKISKIARLNNFYLAQDIPAIFQDQKVKKNIEESSTCRGRSPSLKKGNEKKNARVSETFCQTHDVHVLNGIERKVYQHESLKKIQN